jgi:hypothetical protein
MDMHNIKKTDSKPVPPVKPVEITDLYSFFLYLRNTLKVMNDSKIFAGLMIITLNIASRFVNLKLSKTVESYLKNTFSRQILVFAIAWMGTRDLFVALFITILFYLVTGYLCNEESAFCILPETFTDYHVGLLNDEVECKSFTKEDIEKAFKVLEKARMIIDKSELMPNNNDANANINNPNTTIPKTYFKQSLV